MQSDIFSSIPLTSVQKLLIAVPGATFTVGGTIRTVALSIKERAKVLI
jgi:hypothetical protein